MTGLVLTIWEDEVLERVRRIDRWLRFGEGEHGRADGDR
jgi:hypothetical protein